MGRGGRCPSDPVSRIGVYFKGFYSSKLDDTASWLVFVGYAIVLLAVFSFSTILGIVLLIGLFLKNTQLGNGRRLDCRLPDCVFAILGFLQ